MAADERLALVIESCRDDLVTVDAVRSAGEAQDELGRVLYRRDDARPSSLHPRQR